MFERNKRTVRLTQAGLFLKNKWGTILPYPGKKNYEGASGLIRIGYPGSIVYSSSTAPDLKMELVEPTDINFNSYC